MINFLILYVFILNTNIVRVVPLKHGGYLSVIRMKNSLCTLRYWQVSLGMIARVTCKDQIIYIARIFFLRKPFSIFEMINLEKIGGNNLVGHSTICTPTFVCFYKLWPIRVFPIAYISMHIFCSGMILLYQIFHSLLFLFKPIVWQIIFCTSIILSHSIAPVFP